MATYQIDCEYRDCTRPATRGPNSVEFGGCYACEQHWSPHYHVHYGLSGCIPNVSSTYLERQAAEVGAREYADEHNEAWRPDNLTPELDESDLIEPWGYINPDEAAHGLAYADGSRPEYVEIDECHMSDCFEVLE